MKNQGLKERLISLGITMLLMALEKLFKKINSDIAKKQSELEDNLKKKDDNINLFR